MPTLSDDIDGRPPAHVAIDTLAAGYGGAPVVYDITMTVGRGEVVSIVGPNGAGKSTLLKAVVGVISAMQGTVRLGGEDITNLRTDLLARKGVGYVPQTKDVFDTLTVRENLEMGGYLLAKKPLAERLEETLELFPALRPMLSRLALKLSGGERKMLAIGRVLMLQPSVLVLDEPTAGLSPALAGEVLREHVRRLADAGAAIMLVEQKALEALEMSDWAHVLVAGTTAIAGPAAELLKRDDIREVFLGRGAGE